MTNTEWASIPAAEVLGGRPGLKMGNIADAVVFHGEVPDIIVPADLTMLNAKYRSEFERRRALTSGALKLVARR
jgi:hypothetical protein